MHHSSVSDALKSPAVTNLLILSCPAVLLWFWYYKTLKDILALSERVKKKKVQERNTFLFICLNVEILIIINFLYAERFLINYDIWPLTNK